MKKTIITVVGKDSVGIIAKVCTYLSEKTINILDISQTIVDGYFNMMMIVNMEDATKVLLKFRKNLRKWAKRSIVSSAYSERKFLTKCTASKEDKNCD